MEELLKLKSLWQENLKTSIKLKAPQGEQEMILWFLKTKGTITSNSFYYVNEYVVDFINLFLGIEKRRF